MPITIPNTTTNTRTEERVAYRAKPSKPRTPSIPWRDRSDASLPAQPVPGSAASLSPGPALIEQFAAGSRIARAIVSAWRPESMWQSLVVFREVIPCA